MVNQLLEAVSSKIAPRSLLTVKGTEIAKETAPYSGREAHAGIITKPGRQ